MIHTPYEPPFDYTEALLRDQIEGLAVESSSPRRGEGQARL